MKRPRDGELPELMTDIARRVARLAGAVTVDWPDAGGQAWAERALRLRRELAEQAQTLAELLGGVAPTSGVPPPGRPSAEPEPGVRLGGTEGHRVDDGRGVRIAELPPP